MKTKQQKKYFLYTHVLPEDYLHTFKSIIVIIIIDNSSHKHLILFSYNFMITRKRSILKGVD
jgi:hypothetical protein